MKKVTKVATALLAASLSVLPLASCKSKKKVANSSTDVQIYLWKSGYGAEFMKEIVADFNKKQDKYRVTLEYDEIRRDYYKNFVARVEQYLRFVFHDAQYESIQ